jgi:hypothetical protein
MDRFELRKCLRSDLASFAAIAALSLAISFLLTGKQIWQANWGLIDDHEVFSYLGPRLQLPFSEIWHTLWTTTELGRLPWERFRPGYYLLKLTETSLLGPNVHLWYLIQTVGFAVFLSSIWWLMRRFAGFWLAGVLTLGIAFLPLWAGLWSRLGPSENYGTMFMGVMIFAACQILFSANSWVRALNSIVLVLATIAFITMKETFLPVAAGSVLLLMGAGFRKNLSVPLVVTLVLILTVCVLGIAFIIKSQVVTGGTDFYARSVDLGSIVGFALRGLLSALGKTWWFLIFAVVCWRFLPAQLRADRGLPIAIGIYVFLVVMYVLQCALYRSTFPMHSRYDFPAMLLAPFSFCVMVCYIIYAANQVVSQRTLRRVQIGMAVPILLFVVFKPALSGTTPLVAAAEANIRTTSAFYAELKRAVAAAKTSPDSPIILEAYGPGAYEAVFSIPLYLTALGTKNRIAVRLHAMDNVQGPLYIGLQEALSRFEQSGSNVLTPLREVRTGESQRCLSIGIDGEPDKACTGFVIRVF